MLRLKVRLCELPHDQSSQCREGRNSGCRRRGFKPCVRSGLCGPRRHRTRPLWLFAVPANTDFPSLGRRSLMAPVEAAFFFSIPNILIVQPGGEEVKYGRFEPPPDQYAMALHRLKRVAWSIVGSGGVTEPEERKQVLDLVERAPNFVGVMMDDFFIDKRERKQAALTLEELREIRQHLKQASKKLDLYVTLYTSELDLPLRDYLSLVDVVTLWTSKPGDLANLERNLQKAENLAPGAKKMLGCYLYDFNEKKPLSIPTMRQQCEAALHCLRQERIRGIVILGNTVADLGFESTKWMREWIQKVGESKL